jgi:hypothetical protein
MHYTIHINYQTYLNSNHQGFSTNYHIAFDYISSLVETMVLISILLQCTMLSPIGHVVGEPMCLQLALSEGEGNYRWVIGA